MRRALGIAVLLLAGCAPAVSQQPAALEARDWSDPPSFMRFPAAGRLLPASLPAAPEELSPEVPDAPSEVSAAASSEGDSSSAAHPAPLPKGGADSVPAVRPVPQPSASQKFHWGPALRQSLFLLLVEHGFRLGTQRFTRKATVEGPFFQDWSDSVAGTFSMWDDHDSFWGNYVGHPMQGAVASYIQIQNDPRGIRQEFGRSPQYWKSRMRAMAWSAAFDVQFEIGPVSEATIGNVGKRKGAGGAQDLVVTPVAGLGWTVAEDVVDKYVLRGLEQRSRSRSLRAFARSALNPSRSFANLLRKKAPWHRDTRDGVSAASAEAPPPPAADPPAAAPPAPAPPVDSAKPSCTQPCQ